MDFQVFDNRTVRVVFYQRVFQPGVVNIAFHFLVGKIDVCLHKVTQPHLCCAATNLLASKGVGEVYFVIRIAVFGEAEEVVINAVHQGMAFIFDVAFVRQTGHLLNARCLYPAVEVIIHAAFVIFVGKRRMEEAATKRSFACAQVKIGSDAAVLHFGQRDRLGANAPFDGCAVQIGLGVITRLLGIAIVYPAFLLVIRNGRTRYCACRASHK